jgi:hypothetical protein
MPINKDETFITINRKLIDWEWAQDSKMVHLFLFLILLANHRDKEWQGIVIKRGQFITGLDSLHKITGISVRSLRTSINRLKSTGEITNKSTNKYRLITIVKYDYYQTKKEKRQAERQAERQSNDNQTTATNNDNNVNNTTIATEAVAKVFDSDSYLEEMIKNKQPHISLIGRYLKDRGYSFATAIDVRAEIGQWLKPAKILSIHKLEEIETATNYVKKNWPNEWNLGTIAKYINNPKIYD